MSGVKLLCVLHRSVTWGNFKVNLCFDMNLLYKGMIFSYDNFFMQSKFAH